MRTTNVLLILVGLVIAAPLSAQDQVGTIRVDAPDVEITNDHPITNEISVNLPPPDSAAVEATQRAMDAISEYLATCGCTESGTSNVSVVTNVGLTLAAFFIGWQLKRIADKPNGDTNVEVGDTNVDVNVPPHGRGNDNDDSESH